MECKKPKRQIQEYLDDVLSWDEAAQVESHLRGCSVCGREYRELQSLRDMMQKLEREEAPQDLGLRLRIMASKQDMGFPYSRLINKLDMIVRPLALPAFSGVILTSLFFVLLLGTLFTGASLNASDHDAPVAFFTEPRARSLYSFQFVPFENLGKMKGPITVETQVSDDGHVIAYKILNGPQDRESRRILEQFLYFSVSLDPATSFGRPTHGTLVLTLSFYPTVNDRIDVLG